MKKLLAVTTLGGNLPSCAMLWLLLFSVVSFGFAAGTACAAPPGYYGSCIAMDGLADLRIGPNGQIGVRFMCEHTGAIDRIVQQYQNATPGYVGGTGGRIRWELRTDDGTSNHFPSNKVLWTTIDTNPKRAASGTVLQWFTVSPAVSVTQGALYHIVYTNIDAQPTTNFVSYDGIYTAKNSSPVQPCYSDANLMTLWNGPAWLTNLHITPEFNVHYTDGYAQGTGYIDSTAIKGPATETFTVSGTDKVALSVSAAGGGLFFTLETSTGTVLASGSGSAGAYPGWQTYAFPHPVTLKNGQAYNLVIGGSVYRAVQKGNPYGSYTSFPDGRYTANSAYDLQFYFTLDPVPAPTGLSVISSTNSQVTLGWSPPTGFAPAGYKIYWGAGSGDYTQNVDVQNVTQYTLAGLTGPLYFAVDDYDSLGNESGYSNEVSWAPSPACSFSISPGSQSFGSNGGAGRVSVAASGVGCSWSVSGAPSWIAVTSGSTGVGSGTAAYSVARNLSRSSRTAGLTIAGQPFVVVQAGNR